MMFAFARRIGLVSVLVLAPLSCRALEPSNRPIDGCVASCEAKASRRCTAALCERGCEMILDRIVERESERVIACVANGTRRCTDVVWADCAARVGPHADGGPPGPMPPTEEE